MILLRIELEYFSIVIAKVGSGPGMSAFDAATLSSAGRSQVLSLEASVEMVSGICCALTIKSIDSTISD